MRECYIYFFINIYYYKLIIIYYITKVLLLKLKFMIDSIVSMIYQLFSLATGASRENGERYTRAEPERGESEEQLSRADGISTRTRKDASVFHGGT